MIEKKDFYLAKGDVKIINPEGQTFKMQSIYWDKKNKKCILKIPYSLPIRRRKYIDWFSRYECERRL
jgi:hypothetical protein